MLHSVNRTILTKLSYARNIFFLDIPGSLPEAEKLLSQHQTIKEEIDNYKDEYAKMMEYGEKITAVSIFF